MSFRTQKIAMISGVTGQTGSFLADLLMSEGYYVIGLKRRTSTISTGRIDHLMNKKNFKLVYYSLFDPSVCYRLIAEYQPDEIYNLAAQSHVRVSFDTPIETVTGIVNGCLYWLEAIRTLKPDTKFYQASSSEQFGRNTNIPLNEESVMLPASPYACAKLAAHHLVQNYRESYNMFACSGILLNHESERRGETFVTRKITRAVARIKLSLQAELHLGSLWPQRDWGYAGDYAEAIYAMMQHYKADDFVISTGKTHSVRDWVEKVFEIADMPIRWQGEGINELGYIEGKTKPVIRIDSRLYRPQEVPVLLGDSSKAHKELGWKPRYDLDALARKMYIHDYGMVIEERGGFLDDYPIDYD